MLKQRRIDTFKQRFIPRFRFFFFLHCIAMKYLLSHWFWSSTSLSLCRYIIVICCCERGKIILIAPLKFIWVLRVVRFCQPNKVQPVQYAKTAFMQVWKYFSFWQHLIFNLSEMFVLHSDAIFKVVICIVRLCKVGVCICVRLLWHHRDTCSSLPFSGDGDGAGLWHAPLTWQLRQHGC